MSRATARRLRPTRSRRVVCASPVEQITASTYCIFSHASARVLSYQELLTSFQGGEAMARMQKEERRAGSTSHGMVRR